MGRVKIDPGIRFVEYLGSPFRNDRGLCLMYELENKWQDFISPLTNLASGVLPSSYSLVILYSKSLYSSRGKETHIPQGFDPLSGRRVI